MALPPKNNLTLTITYRYRYIFFIIDKNALGL